MHTGHAYVRYRPGNYYYETAYVCMCAKVYLYHFRDLCITYGNKRSFLSTYFFLAVMITSASFCACEKLFVHIKEAWLKNFGVPFFWILKFSRLLHVTASGVFFYTVICCFTLQFHNKIKIAIENITRLLNYFAIANCHIIPRSKIAKV